MLVTEYMYFYASRLDSSGPKMGVWRPIRNKTRNISVICQDPSLNENTTDIFDDTDINFYSSSSTAMHKESFNIIKALILTCIQLVVFTKMI